MFTEGLIVNGSVNRFSEAEAAGEIQSQSDKILGKRTRAYRTLQQIQTTHPRHIPRWADLFFSIPVTRWQFVWFTIVLTGPSVVVIVWLAEKPILALAMAGVAVRSQLRSEQSASTTCWTRSHVTFIVRIFWRPQW
jgi:hypothetical protein